MTQLRIESKRMRALELNSAHFGVSRLDLMENAGRGIAQYLLNNFKLQHKKIHIYAGVGNNGGDAFVACRYLLEALPDLDLQILILGDRVKTPEARANFGAISKHAHFITDPKDLPKEKPDLILDAILGTGIQGQLRDPADSAIDLINRSKAKVVSIDVPSGMDPDTGEGKHVKAWTTIALHAPKRSEGRLMVLDIGIPPKAKTHAGPGDILLSLRERKAQSHKGDNGRVLILGGSETYTGAPMFAALAALRTGIDLAYLAAPHRVADVAARNPNLITLPLPGEHFRPEHIRQIDHLLKNVDVTVLGPGIGQEPETQAFCNSLPTDKPMVIDADALKLIDAKNIPQDSVLTPHEAEFAALTGKSLSKDEVKRKALVQKYAEKFKCVILLKGPKDLISDGKQVKENDTGNAGMTVGGTGDVLAGIIAGLLAQGATPFEAACAGAFINGKAGDECFKEKKYYFVASDLLEKIPKSLADL